MYKHFDINWCFMKVQEKEPLSPQNVKAKSVKTL